MRKAVFITIILFGAFTAFSDSWETKTPMPTSRGQCAYGVINNKIYIAGGQDSSFTALTILEVYDPLTNSWDTTRQDMNHGNLVPASCVYHNKLYVIGGYDKVTELSSIEIYDPETDTWSDTPANMPTARFDMIAEAINGKIYVIGGVNSGGSRYSTNEIYDIANNTWSTGAPMPSASRGMGSIVYNDNIYIFGGKPLSGVTDKVYIYDPLADTWTEKNSMPTARSYLVSEEFYGKVYCMTGYNGSAFCDLNEIYNIADDSWSTGANSPTIRNWASIGGVHNNIFLIGCEAGAPANMDLNDMYTPNPPVIILFYPANKYSLKYTQSEKLEEVFAKLCDYKTLKLRISGFSDNSSWSDFNKRLSWKRAYSIADYFIGKGIDPERLKIESFGESNPIGDNLTEEGRRKNRRAEIIIEY